MDDIVDIKGRRFRLYMDGDTIASVVAEVAGRLDEDYIGKVPVLCPVLTGSYMFAADLSRAMHIEHEVSFVRCSSYGGTASTGKVDVVLPFSETCRGRHVIIVEDIIESGLTIETMLAQLTPLNPLSVSVCSFVFKSGCFKLSVPPKYVGRSIPDDFIVGYGMDYDGFGRGLGQIYVLERS